VGRYPAVMAMFDPTNLDLTDVDLTAIDLGGVARSALESTGAITARAAEMAAAVARDATYVTVGLSLLTLQRAQVRRREFERSLRR
jgi:hypothetical protein